MSLRRYCSSTSALASLSRSIAPAGFQLHHHARIGLDRADAVDAGDRGDDDDVVAFEQRLRGGVAHAVDLLVDLGVFLDIGVGARDVGFRLVVIVVADDASCMNLHAGDLSPSTAGWLKSVSWESSAPETVVKRIVSAPHFLYGRADGHYVARDLLIFLPSMSTNPLVTIWRGQSFFGNTAAWLNMKNVRWLWHEVEWPEWRESSRYK